MNKFLVISIFGLLISCNSNLDRAETVNTEIIYDTITIIKEMIDTARTENPEFENDLVSSEVSVYEILPEWFLKTELLKGLKFNDDFEIESRINPLYLEADFNGDGNLDIAILIKEIKSLKVGFAIIHRQTNNVYIIGAGTEVKNGLSDNMPYIDIWKVNRNKINAPGIDEDGGGENGALILQNPSLQIEASEIGGGQIYWDGTEYVYFHQTC